MPIFISASAIKDYISCQTKSYYRIYKPKLAIENREMIMGKIAHKAIEKHWKSVDDATEFAESECKRYKFDKLTENTVLHFVLTFFNDFRGYVLDDDKIEQKFKLSLHSDVFLVGVFDRVCNGNVFDWKTNSVTPKRLESDPQFILYNFAYEQLYGSKPASIYLASLRDGSLVRYKESNLYRKELFEKIIPDYISTIRKNSFTKGGMFSGACYRCSYKSDCLKEE